LVTPSFLVSPLENQAAVSFVVVIAIFAFIHYRGPTESIAARYGEWGNLSQGLIYHQVRKYLLLIDTRKQHVKFWRPQILLMMKSFGDQESAREVQDQVGLARFTNYLKKGGLYVLGTVVVGDFSNFRSPPDVGASSLRDAVGALEHAAAEFIDAFKLKAFFEVNVAPTLRAGLQNLLLSAGIGGMKVNTLVLGFPESASKQADDAAEADAFGSAKAKRHRRLPESLSDEQR
jgi:solute carrier family 12 (potassium/chloride transporters), member 9